MMFIEEKLQELPDFKYENPNISLTGRSIPADAFDFYLPVIAQIERAVNTWKEIHFTFDLSYFNTSSTHFLAKIIDVLTEAKRLKIDWYYDDKDDDMLEIAEDFKDRLNCKFKIIKK